MKYKVTQFCSNDSQEVLQGVLMSYGLGPASNDVIFSSLQKDASEIS